MPDSLSLVLIAAAVVGGYLLGSIPFGVIATRLGGAGDVRSIGSGNIGATNVLRTGRKDLAAITLLGDGGKGAVAVLIAWLLTRDAGGQAQATLTALAGGAAFLGHLFPVWLKFKGGKGVATFFGTLLAAAWPVGIAAGATWIVMAFLFRMSSLAALTAAALAPIFVFLLDRPYPIAVMALFMGVLIYIRHKDNIGRLLKGQEPKIGKKKDAA
ncbi:glycerol-3-phosphate acyltransferase [Phenylobacterium sp. Root77]|uniref:glycerol-3-phosphate 1-O-acyltransferase PlsY n=1 Tax=unclassified Phenylobacterium TaxID=2640670 RepID=UPI0006F33A31|nr:MULTISPECIES: glycerol-3-phosphate 1-O-acyltransferase PlsY [unclassified Phenylobacterium]KQW71374.1 glycerol-3-phosphate acyltransferase [Phenylobacterium sp. Root1277]KQW94294.1 glycerol-3-phosphate acyltransferase [Phenylobacterium sp. Root1290]KRC43988.1 glycerol-3-phosphate acyltransferase [Phenylobacterium sp. Root77]